MAEENASSAVCAICGYKMSMEDSINEDGKVLCEDCYIESRHRITGM